mmetsp:Transcript_60073/g.106712  ORF Transcript_60073/g.106712 Transcript_60073/m.106712 type:complete len:299 (+) Transcript_60073:71-967(+)
MTVTFYNVCKLLSCACLVALVTAQAPGKWENKVDESGRKVQQMQIQAPTMTEEDQYGYIMPDRYRCDSCRAVTHQLDQAMQRKQLKSRRLQEWEIQEIFDETCRSGFKGYGITLADGENVLSGPGIERKEVSTGKGAISMGAIQMGGETWEKRLGEICRKFVYDQVGEDELYEHFRANQKVSQELCFTETRDCKSGPQAPPKAKSGEKSAPEQGKKKVPPKKAKIQSKQKQDEVVGSGLQDQKIDAHAFFAKLAAEHGLPAAEYTQKRSLQEWRQLLLRAAGRVYEQGAAKDNQVTQV